MPTIAPPSQPVRMRDHADRDRRPQHARLRQFDRGLQRRQRRRQQQRIGEQGRRPPAPEQHCEARYRAGAGNDFVVQQEWLHPVATDSCGFAGAKTLAPANSSYSWKFGKAANLTISICRFNPCAARSRHAICLTHRGNGGSRCMVRRQGLVYLLSILVLLFGLVELHGDHSAAIPALARADRDDRPAHDRRRRIAEDRFSQHEPHPDGLASRRRLWRRARHRTRPHSTSPRHPAAGD